MALFKVTPIYIKTGATAPSSIHEFDEKKDIQAQADLACYLVNKYPTYWITSTTKLSTRRANRVKRIEDE